MGDIKIQFQPLETDNYIQWAFKMKNYLIIQNVWKAIDGDASPEENQKALALMCVHVTDQHIPTMTSTTSAKEAWLVLEAVYKTKSEARITMLQQNLLNLSKEGGEAVTTYINRAKKIRDELLAAGVNPLAIDIVPAILNGLPSSFTPLRLALLAQADKLSVDDLQSKLISAEALLSMEDSSSSKNQTSTAFSVKVKPSKPPKGSNVVCAWCNATGHYILHCDKMKAARAKEQSHNAFLAF